MSDAKRQLNQRWPEVLRHINGHPNPDEVMDHQLVLAAPVAMSEKLASSRQKGRGGWWSDACSNAKLKAMLKEHVDKGDMRDVMNLAAMIYFREAVGIE